MATKNRKDSLFLHEALAKYFDRSELRLLCFRLGIPYDNLPNVTGPHIEVALEIVRYAKRHARVSDLINACAEERPNVKWSDLPIDSSFLFEPNKNRLFKIVVFSILIFAGIIGIGYLFLSFFPSIDSNISQTSEAERMISENATATAIAALGAGDSDKDGLSDEREEALGTDLNDEDTDKDNLSDGQEVNQYGTNPRKLDTDDDTLIDGDEVNDFGTSPTNGDTDNDGIPDGIEIAQGTNPLSPGTLADTLPSTTETEMPVAQTPPSPTTTKEPTPTLTNTPSATATPTTPRILPTATPRQLYYNDFDGTEVCAVSSTTCEWSNRSIGTTPNGQRILGPFANDTLILEITNLPAHEEVTVSFDLLILRSWDGSSPDGGPDRWEFTVDNNTLINTTFSNIEERNQAYPGNYPGSDQPAWSGASSVDTLGYNPDAVYRISRNIQHSANTLILQFRNITTASDETFGLDSVRVVSN